MIRCHVSTDVPCANLVRWLAYGQPDAPFHSGADRDAHASSKLNSNVLAHSGADRHAHASSKLNSNVLSHSGADRHADAVLQQPADAASLGSTDVLADDALPDPSGCDIGADREVPHGHTLDAHDVERTHAVL